MKLVIDNEELGKGCARVRGGIARRSMVPAMTGIHLQARKGFLTMRACNGSVDIETTRAAEVIEEGETVVHSSFFAWVVHTTENVHLSLKGGRIEAKAGSLKSGFPTFDVAEFPSRKKEPEKAAEIPAAEMKDGMSSIIFASAKSSERPVLQAIRIRNLLFAGDGQRAAFSHLPLDGVDFLMASECIEACMDIITNAEGSVRFGVVPWGSSTWGWIGSSKTKAWLSARAGNYPDRIIDQILKLSAAEKPISLRLDRAEFLRTLGYAQFLSTEAREINEPPQAVMTWSPTEGLRVTMDVKGVGSMSNLHPQTEVTAKTPFEVWFDPTLMYQVIEIAPAGVALLNYFPDAVTIGDEVILPRPSFFVKVEGNDKWGSILAPMSESAISAASRVAAERRVLEQEVKPVGVPDGDF